MEKKIDVDVAVAIPLVKTRSYKMIDVIFTGRIINTLFVKMNW